MSVIAISTPKTSSSKDPVLVVRLCNWDNRPSLGGFSMVPSTQELAERKKSVLKYNLGKLAAAASQVERNLWQGVALQDIREYNRLVRAHNDTKRTAR